MSYSNMEGNKSFIDTLGQFHRFTNEIVFDCKSHAMLSWLSIFNSFPKEVVVTTRTVFLSGTFGLISKNVLTFHEAMHRFVVF